jgi:hypothetical protein
MDLVLYTADEPDMFSNEIEDALLVHTLTHYAGRLIGKAMKNAEDLETALAKSITAVAAAHLPAAHHFRRVYVSDVTGIRTDWLVSDLGLRMLILNADVSNPLVAQLLVNLLSKAGGEQAGHLQF